MSRHSVQDRIESVIHVWTWWTLWLIPGARNHQVHTWLPALHRGILLLLRPTLLLPTRYSTARNAENSSPYRRAGSYIYIRSFSLQ